MSLDKGAKILMDDHDGYLSDESDFYGDETMKEELGAQAASFNTGLWWITKMPTLMEISAQALLKAKIKETPKLHNPYEGHFCAKQLSETVYEFLARLPPATTPISNLMPWIFIANPYWEAKQTTFSREGPGVEGPPVEGSDWTEFGYRGRSLLKDLASLRERVEEENVGKTKGVITKLFNTRREMIVGSLLEAAVRYKCTAGKWMIFTSPEEVNLVWSVIAKAVANNELGTAAKVAPDDGQTRKDRLICIYTRNFTDVADVTRVARKLKDLGVLDGRGRGIYYKLDAYTELGLTSSNEYGIKATMYNSNDILEGGKNGKGKNTKLSGFFYKKDAVDLKYSELN